MLTKEIRTSVLELDVTDRIHLAEILLESIDKTDKQIEKIWVKESESRYKAYKEGRIKGISLKHLRARLEK